MTEESIQGAQESPNIAPISIPDTEDYTGRIIRTLIAVLAGFAAGVICFLTESMAVQSGGTRSVIFPLLVLVAAIIIQRHIFMLIRIDPSKLEKKDWFYQGFMTFSFWFVTWTILLSGIAAKVA